MLFIPISYAVIALIITAICYFYFKEEDLNDPDSIYKRIQEERSLLDAYSIILHRSRDHHSSIRRWSSRSQ